MRYAFILYAGEDMKIEKVEYDLIGNVQQRLDYVKSKIGCEYLEVVRLLRFVENSCLLVDEEGLINTEKPELNLIGSVLYGTQLHGQPIVGNALLCSIELGDEGYDTVGFDENTANFVESVLKEMQAMKGEM